MCCKTIVGKRRTSCNRSTATTAFWLYPSLYVRKPAVFRTRELWPSAPIFKSTTVEYELKLYVVSRYNIRTRSLQDIFSPSSKSISTKCDPSWPSSAPRGAFLGSLYFLTLELKRIVATSDIPSISFTRADEMRSFSTMYAKLSFISSLENVINESEHESHT